MKAAIVRLSALGDIIVSAVFLPYLKTVCPNLEIHWFVDEAFGDILDHSSCIDVLHKLPFKKLLKSKNVFCIYGLWKTLQGCGRYDIVIDLQGLIKSAIIGSMLKKDKFVGFDKNSIREKFASLFYSQKFGIPYQNNILERNAKLIYGAFDYQVEFETCLKDRKNAFGYSANALAKINNLFLNEEKKIVLFVLEASIDNKAYPIEQYTKLVSLLQDLNLKIALLWYEHHQRAQKLFNQICSLADAIILPRLNLDELKALVARVDLVVGGDTGATHLAWAMQRASVTLYGNTPIDRFRLPGGRNISLSGNLNANYDKNDFSICSISPQMIEKAIREIL